MDGQKSLRKTGF